MEKKDESTDEVAPSSVQKPTRSIAVVELSDVGFMSSEAILHWARTYDPEEKKS